MGVFKFRLILLLFFTLSCLIANLSLAQELRLGSGKQDSEKEKLKNLISPSPEKTLPKGTLNLHLPKKQKNLNYVAFDTKLIIVISNDSFSVNLSDRHLTSRIRMGTIRREIPSHLQTFIDSRNYLVMTLSQDIFTPDDIENAELIEDDRPYAGWLYLTLGKIKQRGEQLTILTADLGIVGPSAKGERAQTVVHRQTDSDQPMGWQHQLADELGLKLNYKKMFRKRFTLNKMIAGELIRFYGGSVGNIRTSLEAGGVLRVGYNLPNDFGIGFKDINERDWVAFGYVKVTGEYVLQDIFLDGNTLRDSHSVNKKEAIANFTAGLTVQKGNWGASLVQSITSEEFGGQDGADTLAEFRVFYNFYLR